MTLAYGKAVREVGLFPVYPPREEFQIGDVYMWSQSISDPNDTVSVYLLTLDWLRQKADDFMASRIVFRNTDSLDLEDPDYSSTDIPEGSSDLALRGDHREPALSRSLPIAAFPTVSADAGFTAGAGLVNVLTSVGLAGGSRTIVTLDFNDVRTYWVPTAQVLNDIRGDLAPKIGPLLEAGTIDRDRLVKAKRGIATAPCSNGRRCGISVVTRVYLTRQINYTYRNNRIVAAALRIAEKPGATAPLAPSINVTVKTDNQGVIDSADIDTQLVEIRKQLDNLGANNAQGQAFRFESWNARGVTFSSRYQRPVVVGWDGADLSFM
ncbi:hypothetical protein [Mesorhizobium australicum]|nr:hypothetical protein [Mesorhizobium australicum]